MTNSQPLTLSVHHLIYLNRDERYKIHFGEKIKTVGVSVPVWFISEISTEPAREVFCNYYLSNPKRDFPIEIMKDGYSIPLPYKPSLNKTNITNEEWFNFTKHEREIYEGKIRPRFTSENLLDYNDGGSKFLFYREHNKIKQNGKWLSIIHFVQISDMEDLKNSITLLDNHEVELQVAE